MNEKVHDTHVTAERLVGYVAERPMLVLHVLEDDLKPYNTFNDLDAYDKKASTHKEL